jgi:LacI family transcriptional regulator
VDFRTKLGTGVLLPSKPTLKTIAQLCGLGVPTVSRAMNDAPGIGEETKRRVRQIAEEIGYVPDRAALRLRTGRTQAISLAFAIYRDDQLGQLISSIAAALDSTPYQVGIAPMVSNERALEPIRQVVEGRLADAVIFNETLIDDPRVEYLLERGFPFATHGRDSLAHLHPYFDYDNHTFGRKAVGVLHKRGRHHVALLGPRLQYNYGTHTFVGASEAAVERGLFFEPISGAYSNSNLSELQSAARQFVADRPECDGFICSSSHATLAIASALEEAGRVVGRDADIIAKGSRVTLSMIRPAILVIEEDVGRAAEFLTQAVLQAIQSPNRPPMQYLEQPDFSLYD